MILVDFELWQWRTVPSHGFDDLRDAGGTPFGELQLLEKLADVLDDVAEISSLGDDVGSSHGFSWVMNCSAVMMGQAKLPESTSKS